MEGWVKIHRKICGWEWFTEPFTAHLFIYLLLNANREEKVWRGQTVLPGQVITGRDSLSANTGLSSNQIRTAIERLKKTGEITSKITNKFSIITIVKWIEYQTDHQPNHQQTTSKPPANHQQTTTTKKDKKEEKEKNIPLTEKLAAFIDHRKALKKPMTKQAIELFIKKLDKLTDEGYDVDELIDTAIEHGWLTVYPPKSNRSDIKKQDGIPPGWKLAGI